MRQLDNRQFLMVPISFRHWFAAAFLFIATGTVAAKASVQTLEIDLFVGQPVTIEEQTIYFLEEGWTPSDLGFPGMTKDELIALMEEPEHSILSVPEPSTWAMMLVGFAGLGYAGYRASRKTVAAAGISARDALSVKSRFGSRIECPPTATR